MCGIIGFNYEDKSFLKTALKQINHRGPDDSGIFLDNNISLGHKRLSIIDLSKSGKQPMSNENQTIWIIFNGEIYNFKELRVDLEQKGHQFYTQSDTEVIVHAYEEYDEDCVKQLRGQFAFCVYDSRKELLFLARDHMGLKPLYYYFDNNRFIFVVIIVNIFINPIIF